MASINFAICGQFGKICVSDLKLFISSIKSAKYLDDDITNYPKKISYYTPPEHVLEALEVGNLLLLICNPEKEATVFSVFVPGKVISSRTVSVDKGLYLSRNQFSP